MKWCFFLLGFLPAVIVVMAMILLVSDSQVVASAKSRMNAAGETLLMIPSGLGGAAAPGSGAVTTNNSFLWVGYRRTPLPRERKVFGKGSLRDRFTIAMFRANSFGGRTKQGSVTLLAARDITYDLRLISLDAAGTKEYRDLRLQWEDTLDKLNKKPN